MADDRAFEEIEEEGTKVLVPIEKKVSKDLPVFYNPVMKLNRDVSIHFLNAYGEEDMQMALPLAGTGIRGVRMLKELDEGIIRSLAFNDYSADALDIIKKNLSLNGFDAEKDEKIILSENDANDFVLASSGFDYIDIDPFGTPNPFLDSAVKRISRNGILAVTATDTSCLSGTYPKACMRKYWAHPCRTELKHETGLRILIRKVQMIGAQFDKALIPLYCYSKNHYMRVFFRCDKGKTRVDNVLKQHGMFGEYGPMWLGDLWDTSIAEKISDSYPCKMTSEIYEESLIKVAFFYDIHAMCKELKMAVPLRDDVVGKIESKGYKWSLTHFVPTAIRSDIPREELISIIKSLKK